MRRASLLLLLFAFLAEGAEAEKGGVGRDAREIGPAPRLNEEAKPTENAGPMMVEEFLKKHGLTVPRDESGAVPDPTDLPSGITIPLPPLPPMPESLKRESEEEEEEEDEAPAVVPALPALPAATIAPAPVLPLVEAQAQEDEVPKIETLEAVAPKREIALPLGPSSGITIAPPPGVFEEEPAKEPASIIGDDPFHRQIPLPDVPDAGAGGEEAGPKEEFDNNPIAEDGSLKRPWSRFLNSRFVITVPPPPPERQQTIGIPDELLNPTTTTTTTTRRTTTTPLTTTTTTEATTTTTTTTPPPPPPPPPAPLLVLPVETPVDTSGTTPIPIPSIEELRRASVAPFVIELLQGEPSANDLVFIRQIIAQNRHLRPTTTTLPPPLPPPAPVPVVVPEVKAEVPLVETKEEPQVPQTLAQEVTTTTAPAAPDFAAPAKTGNFDSLVTDFLKKKSETGGTGQIEKHSEFVSSRKKPRRKNRKHRHRKTHRTGLRKSGNFRRHRKTVSGDTVQHKKRRSERRHRQSAAAVVPEVALPSMSEILLAEPQLDAPPEFAAAPPVDADMPDITIDRQRQARRQRREVDRSAIDTLKSWLSAKTSQLTGFFHRRAKREGEKRAIGAETPNAKNDFKDFSEKDLESLSAEELEKLIAAEEAKQSANFHEKTATEASPTAEVTPFPPAATTTEIEPKLESALEIEKTSHEAGSESEEGEEYDDTTTARTPGGGGEAAEGAGAVAEDEAIAPHHPSDVLIPTPPPPDETSFSPTTPAAVLTTSPIGLVARPVAIASNSAEEESGSESTSSESAEEEPVVNNAPPAPAAPAVAETAAPVTPAPPPPPPPPPPPVTPPTPVAPPQPQPSSASGSGSFEGSESEEEEEEDPEPVRTTQPPRPAPAPLPVQPTFVERPIAVPAQPLPPVQPSPEQQQEFFPEQPPPVPAPSPSRTKINDASADADFAGRESPKVAGFLVNKKGNKLDVANVPAVTLATRPPPPGFVPRRYGPHKHVIPPGYYKHEGFVYAHSRSRPVLKLVVLPNTRQT